MIEAGLKRIHMLFSSPNMRVYNNIAVNTVLLVYIIVLLIYFKMKDFLIVIPCYTERKRKISSFLFKTKLLKDIFKTNNKICFAAVFLMISYIALYWKKKKA